MSGPVEMDKANNPCQHNPYPGLRPYEEDEQHQFFGRDDDTRILLDKILTHRLSLLFAATGVGKSSLLKAAVIPKLKSASGKHLDVVYYNDWVTAPLTGLKAEIRKTVEQSTNWPQGTVLDESLELADFVQFCTLFVRPPLVIMLDQFEELFRYRHKYHGKTFQPFIDQLTGLITATQIPVSVVFSMREDFALELNTFKPKLPTLLFENYYRLERLPAKAARQAIVEPLRDFRFSYEKELLEQLLQDLLKHDPDRDLSSLGADDETETVIPPQLQIVCSQLWQRECNSADRMLHLAAYEEAERAEGLLKNYVEESLKSFNAKDRRVLSRAFDHLVSIEGTKMPHTVATLAEKINFSESSFQHALWWIADRISRLFKIKLPGFLDKLALNDAKYITTLQRIMEKLASSQVRILRSQQRDQKTWYELYHDMYSAGINDWNRLQKRKMLIQRIIFRGGSSFFALLLTTMVGLWSIHSLSYHVKAYEDSARYVEIWSGNKNIPDIFDQRKYLYELDIPTKHVRANTLIEKISSFSLNKIFDNIGDHLHLEEEVTRKIKYELISGKPVPYDVEFLRASLISRKKNLFNQLKLNINNTIPRSFAKNELLRLFRSNTFLLEDKELLNFKPYDRIIKSRKKNIVRNSIKKSYDPRQEKAITYLLKHPSASTRVNAAFALGQMRVDNSKKHLIDLLKLDKNYRVRVNSALALGKINNNSTTDSLISALSDPSLNVRRNAAYSLRNFDDEKIRRALINSTKDKDFSVRKFSILALEKKCNLSIGNQVINLLNDPHPAVRNQAIILLGKCGYEEFIPNIITMINDAVAEVRASAVFALGLIGDTSSFDIILNIMFKDSNPDVKNNCAISLGLMGSKKDAYKLYQSLKNQNPDSLYILNAIERIGNKDVIDKIFTRINMYQDFSIISKILSAVGNTGLKKHSKAIKPYVDHESSEVRDAAIKSYVKLLGSDALDLLTRKFNEESVDEVIITIIDNIGEIGDFQSIPLLLKRLNSIKEIKVATLKALSKIHSPLYEDYLIDNLESEDPEIRKLSLYALGKSNNIFTLNSIQKLTHDIDIDVSNTAKRVMREMGFPTHLEYEKNKKPEPSYFSWKEKYLKGNTDEKYKLETLLNLPNSNHKTDYITDTFLNYNNHIEIRRTAMSFLREEISNPLFYKKIFHDSNEDYIIKNIALDGMASSFSMKELPNIIFNKKINYNTRTLALKRAVKLGIDIKHIIKIFEDSSELIPVLSLALVKNPKTSNKKIFKTMHNELKNLTDKYKETKNSLNHNYSQKNKLLNLSLKNTSINMKFISYYISYFSKKSSSEMLFSNLHSIREGAILAIGTKSNIKLIKDLNLQRENHRDNPGFRHAAYKAIDWALRRLEVFNDKNGKVSEKLVSWHSIIKENKYQSKRFLGYMMV